VCEAEKEREGDREIDTIFLSIAETSPIGMLRFWCFYHAKLDFPAMMP